MEGFGVLILLRFFGLRQAGREGKKDLVFRVIARGIAPKHPVGTSAKVRVSPLGCFAMFAMTRL